jgi:predicted nucleic acid-binding protein
MKKILIDLSIILDMLNKRQDHESAARIINKCFSKNVRGYICSHEITTLSYFMEKEKYPQEKIKFTIAKLLDIFSVIPSSEKILRNTLLSAIDDYEDAVIEASALHEKIDYIISRNLEDFKKSNVPAIDSKEALAMFADL